MSEFPAGWYPDGSGRFAQRYYDGQAWTEYVLDAGGNSGTDPVGLGAPAQYGDQRDQAAPTGSWISGASARPSSVRRQPHVPSSQRPPGGQQVTVGHLITAVGVVLLLLSLFVLDFLASDSERADLGEIADAPGDVAGFLLGSYAGVGRFLALLVIAAAVVATLSLRALGSFATRLPLIVAIVCAVFALWHLLAMLVHGDIDASPSFDAFLGLVAYGALAGGAYVRRPLIVTPTA